jgi:hypothetical protein
MEDTLNISGVSLTKIGLYCVASFTLYLTATYLILMLKDKHTIYDAAIILKVLSFLTVIWVNGEVILGTKKEPSIRRMNSAIIILIVIILFGLIMKYIEIDFSRLTNISSRLSRFLYFFTDYITWIAITPMLFYGLLDYYIMRRSDSNSDTRNKAKAFFVFNDVVCLLPLVVISSIGLMALSMGIFTKADLETMVGGALVATLFASAFATKTIELCYGGRA